MIWKFIHFFNLNPPLRDLSEEKKNLLWQDVDALTQQGRQDEPEGVHGGEGLSLLLLCDLGLRPDGPHRVARAGKDRLVERVRPADEGVSKEGNSEVKGRLKCKMSSECEKGPKFISLVVPTQTLSHQK